MKFPTITILAAAIATVTAVPIASSAEPLPTNFTLTFTPLEGSDAVFAGYPNAIYADPSSGGNSSSLPLRGLINNFLGYTWIRHSTDLGTKLPIPR